LRRAAKAAIKQLFDSRDAHGFGFASGVPFARPTGSHETIRRIEAGDKTLKEKTLATPAPEMFRSGGSSRPGSA
jgi:hypothetical protein